MNLKPRLPSRDEQLKRESADQDETSAEGCCVDLPFVDKLEEEPVTAHA